MPKMKAVQVPKAGGDLEVVERDIPEAGSGQVRIRVQACGVCYSDVVPREGLFPGISYPSRSWTRSCRDNRPGRTWREGLEQGRPCWRGLARRAGRYLHRLQERRFRQLRKRAGVW